MSLRVLFFVICSVSTFSQKLIVSSPQELANDVSSNGTVVHASPLGYKPKSGWLHGNMQIASP